MGQLRLQQRLSKTQSAGQKTDVDSAKKLGQNAMVRVNSILVGWTVSYKVLFA